MQSQRTPQCGVAAVWVGTPMFSGMRFDGSTTRLHQASSLSYLRLLTCSLSLASSLPLCFSPSSLSAVTWVGTGCPDLADGTLAFQFPTSQREGRCLLDRLRLLDALGSIVFSSILGALCRMSFTMAFNIIYYGSSGYMIIFF